MAKQAGSAAETGHDLNIMRTQIVKTLSDVKVSEMSLPNNALILDSSISPKEAIKMLVDNKKRAAPVREGDAFIGVLDLKDTLKFVLAAYDKMFPSANSADHDEHKDEKAEYVKSADPNEVHAKEYLIGDHSAMKEATLAELCRQRPFRLLKSSDSLLDLASLFALGSHVVGVIQESKLVTVCSQGVFFQEIAKRCKLKDSCTLSKLLELGYITSEIKSVNKNARAIQAFRLMDSCGISGLAVLNEYGTLVHNTSATDIKLWLLKGEQSLDSTIETFIINIRNLSFQERYPITVCQLQDTFKRAIQKLQATKYHRLWIVDQSTKPLGVMALTDIFCFIVKSKEQNVSKDKVEVQTNQKEEAGATDL